jgi:hypothetical protein
MFVDAIEGHLIPLLREGPLLNFGTLEQLLENSRGEKRARFAQLSLERLRWTEAVYLSKDDIRRVFPALPPPIVPWVGTYLRSADKETGGIRYVRTNGGLTVSLHSMHVPPRPGVTTLRLRSPAGEQIAASASFPPRARGCCDATPRCGWGGVATTPWPPSESEEDWDILSPYDTASPLPVGLTASVDVDSPLLNRKAHEVVSGAIVHFPLLPECA